MRAKQILTDALLVTVSLLVMACTKEAQKIQVSPQRATDTVVTIAAITDFHGALEPLKGQSGDGKTVVAGGAANLSSHLRALRNSVPGPLFLIDGGDMFQGTMESNLFEGSPVIRLYNYFGVQAAALGNHEFDFGPVGEKAVPRSIDDDPRGALKERALQADFPILAANVEDLDGKVPAWARASVVVEQQGVRVGIIGAASENTPATTNRMNLKGLVFTNPVPAVIKEARRLREEENVHAIVLTIHDGGGCDDNRIDAQDDLSSCTIRDVFAIVEALPEGTVDVAVAGHTHRTVAKRIGRTAILQAGSSGQFVAWAEVNVTDRANRPEVKGLAEVCGNKLAYRQKEETLRTCDLYRVKKLSGELEPARFLGVAMSPDPRVPELLKKELSSVKEIKERPLGVLALTPLAGSYGTESALGNLVADATKAALPSSEIGLANGGGLRAPLPEGQLLYGDIFAVLPFDNQLARMKVSGLELKKIMELGISGKQGALLWSGLTFMAKGCEVTEALVNGEPLQPLREYTVATSDYLALGGSGMSTIGIPESRVEVFWDRPFILRDKVAGVLPTWKTLSSAGFYNRESPRQRREGTCP